MNSEVSTATWEEDSATWLVETATGPVRADVLVSALGAQLGYLNFDYNPGQVGDLDARVAGIVRPFNGYLRAEAPLLHTDRELDTVVKL